MTCARDDGRDDTAPYWTALRKYNGAPLLRCVHPILDVGVGAAPLPRSERVYAFSPLGGASRLFFLSFYLASSTALVCPPRRLPFNSPGVLAGTSSLLASAILAVLFLVVVLLFLLPSWSPRDPPGIRDAPQRFLQRATRVQRRASGAHRWLLPLTLKGLDATRKARSSRARLARFSLASLFSPSSHPRSPFCARRGGNRVQLKLRSRAHRSR